MKYTMTVGIDPDVHKSGFCIVKGKNIVEVAALPFPALIDRLARLQDNKECPLIIVEGGWLNKSLWHFAYDKGVRVCGNIGAKTGANHQTGKHIVEMCEHFGLVVKVQKPLGKRWKGRGGKITHKELQTILLSNGYSGLPCKVSNQDERDSVLLAIACNHI